MGHKRSSLERGFYSVFTTMFRSAPQPKREHKFHPTRKWRIDFCWPAHKVAVEIEGGVFIGGGHTRGLQFTQDCEKYNAMTMMGYRLLRFTTLDLRKRPIQCCEQVVELLNKIQPRELAEQQELFGTEF